MIWSDPTDWNTEEYTTFESNRFLSVLTSPLSTFAADVDTSSYAQFRRKVLDRQTVPADSIRIEEMLNYKAWYLGHWHINKRIDRLHFLMHDVEVLIDETER